MVCRWLRFRRSLSEESDHPHAERDTAWSDGGFDFTDSDVAAPFVQEYDAKFIV